MIDPAKVRPICVRCESCGCAYCGGTGFVHPVVLVTATAPWDDRDHDDPNDSPYTDPVL